MTTVFFLFLVHSALGLLVTLPLVPERAGARYFKFCSAAATFMAACGFWLAFRRYGTAGGPGAPGGPNYVPVLACTAAALFFCVLYNRARHFGWGDMQKAFLATSILTGLAGVVIGAPASQRALVSITDLTSVLLLGAAAAAMILGHWYLVVLDLPILALRRLTVLLVVALVLRAVVVGFALSGPVHTGFDDARAVAVGLWSPDGVFVWMRVLFGIVGPFSLIWFIWKTVEIRSTQSATGILYVQLFLVMSGELLAKYLRIAAGLPPVKAPEISFYCAKCGIEATSGLDGQGRCAQCGTLRALPLTASLREQRIVDRCPACDGEQLYVQRDFNQKAGLAIVILGGALAPFTPFYSSLFVAAAIDALLYALLPEITVCYRCHAHFRGFARNPKHVAFDLHLAEQYEVRPAPPTP